MDYSFGVHYPPYDLTLKVLKLGFNKSIYAWYQNKDKKVYNNVEDVRALGNEVFWYKYDHFIDAPTWQQVFDWFGEKYDLHSHCDLKSKNSLGENYYFKIINASDIIDESTTFILDGFTTKNKAREGCLEYLLKFVF